MKFTDPPTLDDVQKVLDHYGVRHFPAKEVTLHARWGEHRIPPLNLIENIGPTAQLADSIRSAWGGAVKCVSGYRIDEYNQLVGGVEDSEHKLFRAMDLTPKEGRIDAFKKVVKAAVYECRRAGNNVGLGLYDTFCHIDVGSDKPPQRTWYG